MRKVVRLVNGTSAYKISPLNLSQKTFLDIIANNDIIFSSGPAGCGKTFLATMSAVRAFQLGEINKIILVRPAVEACGEKLGFLPGDMLDKMDPFLAPIFDAMNEVWQNERIEEYISQGAIEVVPLGYMRGRTFKHSYVITDEAQNMSEDQMLMLLTRIGEGCKMIIGGDESQSDLSPRISSGLKKGLSLAGRILSIEKFIFDRKDSVRHPLIEQIIEAWTN